MDASKHRSCTAAECPTAGKTPVPARHGWRLVVRSLRSGCTYTRERKRVLVHNTDVRASRLDVVALCQQGGHLASSLERDACLWSRGARWRGLRGAARAKGPAAAVLGASEGAHDPKHTNKCVRVCKCVGPPQTRTGCLGQRRRAHRPVSPVSRLACGRRGLHAPEWVDGEERCPLCSKVHSISTRRTRPRKHNRGKQIGESCHWGKVADLFCFLGPTPLHATRGELVVDGSFGCWRVGSVG